MRWIVSSEPAVPLAGALRWPRRCWRSGVAQIPNAKVDVFPEFAPPQVEIQTIALGNSSNEVEELITVPIEEQLNGIEGLDELRSKSVAQLSVDPAHLQARHRRAAGPPARDRAHRAGHADAADLGQPAVHDAAAVGHQPDHEDRPDLRTSST